MSAFYVIGVLFCLGTILVWLKGTNNNTFGVTHEEGLVFKIAVICCIVPLLNFMAGGLLLWHIAKRMRVI